MIEIGGKRYNESLIKSLEFHEWIPEDYTETELFFPFSARVTTHHSNTKNLDVYPKLQIMAKGDSKLFEHLNMYAGRAMRIGAVKKDMVFNINDLDTGSVFLNCFITSMNEVKTNEYMFEITCDFYNGDCDGVLGYCGRYQVPITLNDNYLEYVKTHRKSFSI